MSHVLGESSLHEPYIVNLRPDNNFRVEARERGSAYFRPESAGTCVAELLSTTAQQRSESAARAAALAARAGHRAAAEVYLGIESALQYA